MAHLAMAVGPRVLALRLALGLILASGLGPSVPAEAAQTPPQVALGRIELARASTPDPVLEAGLATLMGHVRRRTTLALADKPNAVKLALPSVLDHPLLVWRGEGETFVLSPKEREALRAHLGNGGTLWVDAADGDIAGPTSRSIRSELEGLWPGGVLKAVPSDFVLTRSFYLLRGQLGRKTVPTPLRGLFREGRLVAVVTEGDVLGALAARADGSYLRALEGGEEMREMAVRFGINWLMYAMCLDYKDDQVHLPFILKRRSL